jgi:3-hydroxyisobutyrate dehydrogenase/2-hydroxy-3-oxopropionate reductase
MVGGEAAAFARVQPLLAAFSARQFHVGPVGAGSVVKLANQLLVGANTVAAMEAVSFAARAGIDPQVVLDVIGVSAGDSVMLRRSIRDFVQTRDFAPAFAMRLLVKDLRLYIEEARSLGAATPSGAPALSLYEAAMAEGLSTEDYAAVLKLIERLGS